MCLLSSCQSLGKFCCLFVIAIGLHAQPANSGSIAGTVLNRSTNSPIRRAIVTLSTVEAQPQDAVAWTDAEGQFSFRFLPAGVYRLHASHDGFQNNGSGAETGSQFAEIIHLAIGENRTGLSCRLSPLSTVSGVVLNDAGDPLPGAQIQILTPHYERRKRTLLYQGTGTFTDAEGRYRISDILPGKYIVTAQFPQPFVKYNSEVSTGQVEEPRTYGLQYFSGTSSAEAATYINLESGKEVEQISFRLMPSAPTVTVEGRVSVPAGVGPTSMVLITLLSTSFGQQAIITNQASPPDFHFRMENLRPDRYWAFAEASVDGTEYIGRQEVDLRAQSTTGITLTLESGIELSGRVTLEGLDAAKHSIQYVSLKRGDFFAQLASRTLRAVVSKDGAFTVHNVTPGIWDIEAGPIPQGGYVKSIRLGTKDVLTEDMVVSGKTTVPLSIVVGTQAASVEGQVSNSAGKPVEVAVLLAPEEKFRNVTSFYRVANSDEKGFYKMTGITPGKYRLYALAQLDPSYIQDSGVLKPLDRYSVSIELKESVTSKQNLIFVPGAGGNE